jgi:hypothetical protein
MKNKPQILKKKYANVENSFFGMAFVWEVWGLFTSYFNDPNIQ